MLTPSHVFTCKQTVRMSLCLADAQMEVQGKRCKVTSLHLPLQDMASVTGLCSHFSRDSTVRDMEDKTYHGNGRTCIQLFRTLGKGALWHCITHKCMHACIHVWHCITHRCMHACIHVWHCITQVHACMHTPFAHLGSDASVRGTPMNSRRLS